jgi:hypothetical protein
MRDASPQFCLHFCRCAGVPPPIASVYFLESGLFNGLRPIQIKNLPPSQAPRRTSQALFPGSPFASPGSRQGAGSYPTCRNTYSTGFGVLARKFAMDSQRIRFSDTVRRRRRMRSRSASQDRYLREWALPVWLGRLWADSALTSAAAGRTGVDVIAVIRLAVPPCATHQTTVSGSVCVRSGI